MIDDQRGSKKSYAEYVASDDTNAGRKQAHPGLGDPVVFRQRGCVRGSSRNPKRRTGRWARRSGLSLVQTRPTPGCPNRHSIPDYHPLSLRLRRRGEYKANLIRSCGAMLSRADEGQRRQNARCHAGSF